MSLYFYTGEPDAGADDGQESHKATLDEIIDELKAYGLPNLEAAVKAQTDKLMEGYVIFRNPEQGGSELERYEVVEMLEWSMSDALVAALTTPQGDDG